MTEEIKRIMEDPDIVGAIIWRINNKITVPEPHNIHSYFLYGHCNVYAQILTQIFEGVAIPYTDGVHVIVKIGDFFYDVEGLIPPYGNMDLSKYCEITIDELYDLPYRGVGAFLNKIDDELIELGAAIGKEHLEELISIKFGSKKKH